MTARSGPRLSTLLALLAVPLIMLLLTWLALGFLRQGGATPFRVPVDVRLAPPADAAMIERGRALAQIGNCGGCHGTRGGAPYAGGRAFHTPWGTVYSSNLTPHPDAGIGAWSLAEFRHAMRHGVSRNGVLTPVFPYPYFDHLSDDDIDALFAFLTTVPPVADAPPPHALGFPANLPGAMTVWRLLYYRPLPLPPLPADDPQLARGRDLVHGIGHCGMCHGGRGQFAAVDDARALAGGRIPGWYAPPLDRDALARYSEQALADYLRHGRSPVASAWGPMADVVFANLQHLPAQDAAAMAAWLKALPPHPRPRGRSVRLAATAPRLDIGERLYRQHCADCHGHDGGGSDGGVPPLPGAVALTVGDPVNAVNAVMLGATAPATAGNPRPRTMPPFAQVLSADDVAAVVNYMRARWGRDAPAVSADEVRAHGGAFRP